LWNRRVLAEAQDENTPLLERAKFLAIVSTNLDEFCLVSPIFTIKPTYEVGFLLVDSYQNLFFIPMSQIHPSPNDAVVYLSFPQCRFTLQ
jgi:hypothetical protein